MKLQSDYTPRLVDHGGDISKTWYIDYRIWDTDKQAFVRKLYTGMNKYKSLAERKKFSKVKLKELRDLLEQGYTAGKKRESDLPINPDQATLVEAAELVIQLKTGNRSSETIDSFNTVVKRLKECPATKSLKLRAATYKDMFSFINWCQKKYSLGPKSHNNYKGYLSTIFNFYVKLGALPHNPCLGLERQTVEKSEKHYPYTEQQRLAIKDAILAAGDQQLFLFISFIYYCAIRNGKELRLLKIKDIRDNTIYIPSTRAKTNRGEHIGIPPPLERLIQEHNLRSYPKEYFVFTAMGIPGTVAAGLNYFYKRHKAVLQKLGLTDQAYTIYGYKHTGAINLYKATGDLELVRQHCRHTHAGQTATYLRELGILRNEDALKAFPEF